MKDSAIIEKSKCFAIRIVNLYKYLQDEKKEFVMSKQIIRSGTSIGANVKEAVHGVSKPDFYNKMNIALKEACETEYWLELLVGTDYIDQKMYDSLNADCQEIIKILVSITKSKNHK